MTFRSNSTLHLALSAALTARRAAILRHLLSSHGPSAFGLAIASRPSRQSADFLTMLAPTERTAIYRYLPKEARVPLAEVDMTFFDQLAFTRKKSILSATRDWLLRKPCIADRVVGPTIQRSSSRMPTPWAMHPPTLNDSQKMVVSA